MRTLIAALVVVLVVLQFTLWLGNGGRRDLAGLEQEVARQQEELAQLRFRNEALAAEVRNLQQGLDAVEELARSEMGMIKKGEVFYRIIEAADAGEPAHDTQR
ncbi:MAG: cell division protein FtsB [Gammaproteobacteria bacterium]|nr:cell division protein FtsB [Gammaproteobacteria bacterium]